MAGIPSVIPFEDVVNMLENAGDDNFEPSFDETYGNPSSVRFKDDDFFSRGIRLIFMTFGFCVALLLLRFGINWFIDAVILCDCQRAFGRCCPCFFRRSQEDTPEETNHGSSDSDDSDSDSRSDSSSVGTGMELVEQQRSNSSYAKRLLRNLTKEQKRSIFVSIVDSRNATKADAMGGEISIAIPLGSGGDATTGDKTISTPESTPPPSPPNNDATVSTCPICINDIRVGDRVYQCQNCHRIFRLDCMLEWMGTGSTLCPYCRREIYTRAMLEEAYRNSQQQQQKQPKKGA